MKRLLFIAAALALFAGAALAHGNEVHMVGKVTTLSDRSITVETPKKETKTVEITPETTFVKSGSPATTKDLRIGDRVVIHAKRSGNKLRTEVVRFGSTASKEKHQ